MVDLDPSMLKIVVYRLIFFSLFHVVQSLMRICRKGLLVTGGKIDVRRVYGPHAVMNSLCTVRKAIGQLGSMASPEGG